RCPELADQGSHRVPDNGLGGPGIFVYVLRTTNDDPRSENTLRKSLPSYVLSIRWQNLASDHVGPTGPGLFAVFPSRKIDPSPHSRNGAQSSRYVARAYRRFSS